MLKFYILIHAIKTKKKAKNKDWFNLVQNNRAMTYDTPTTMLLRTRCVVESVSQVLDRRWSISPEA